jgi:O-antigen/teichoic acid export membrane protein
MSIRRNTAINIIGSLLPMGLMLATIPLYLRLLGDARYGVLALVWLVLGYLSFLDVGLGKAVASHIARAHDRGDRERSEILWTALVTNALLGVTSGALLYVAGRYALGSEVIKMPAAFRAEAMEALPWVAAALPLALTSSVLTGALEGMNRFGILNVLQFAGSTVIQVAPLMAAYWVGPGLEVVVPVAVLSKVTMNVPLLIACQRIVVGREGMRLSWNTGRTLLRHGGWYAVSGIVCPLLETLDKFVVGSIVGAQAVAFYTVSYQVAGKVRIIPASLSKTLFPRFSASLGGGELVALTALRMLSAVITPIVVSGFFLLHPFLHLWIGPAFAQAASPVGRIFLMGMWLSSLVYVPTALIQGSGNPDTVARVHLFELIPFIVVLYFSTVYWALIGAAMAWLFRVALDLVLMSTLAGIAERAARATGAFFALTVLALILSDTMVAGPITWIAGVALTALSLWLGWTELSGMLQPSLIALRKTVLLRRFGAHR